MFFGLILILRNMKKRTLAIAIIGFLCLFLLPSQNTVYASTPFSRLNVKPIVLRSQFYTTYSNSSDERKCNIERAAKSLNNTLVLSGAEFSFNDTVGKRSMANGYKVSKIIFNGKFIDGVGGGVCQVSTTLYNAVVLANLRVSEYHPHSLPVSYVAPSFDAMVNSGSADLRFVNTTDNPIIIKTETNGQVLKIQIWGEKLDCKIKRVSQKIEEIPAPREEVVIDIKNEYGLKAGERKVITYSKGGLISEGYIEIDTGKGKIIKKIRKDKYNAMQGLIMEGNGEEIVEDKKDIGEIEKN